MTKLSYHALIPARGGSVGVPRKNIKDLSGRPLISYPIQAALNCNYFDKVWVSTEDSEIADMSIGLGAEVLYRPEKLATPIATTDSVIEHFFEHVSCDVVCVLEPTSPFIDEFDLVDAIEIFDTPMNKLDSMFSVVHATDIYVIDNLKKPLEFINFDQGKKWPMRDEKDSMYRMTGFHIVKKEAFAKYKQRACGKWCMFPLMNAVKGFEIDSVEDWDLCEVMMDDLIERGKR